MRLPPADIIPKLALLNASRTTNPVLVKHFQDLEAVTKLTKDVEGVLVDLSRSQLLDKVAGETEVEIRQANIEMVSRRLTREDLLGSDIGMSDTSRRRLATRVSAADDPPKFTLPASAFDNLPASQTADFVDYSLLFFKKNPYGWYGGKEQHKYLSRVTSLVLRGKDGSELPIKELRKDWITMKFGIDTTPSKTGKGSYVRDARYTANCQWWDAKNEKWSSTNCNVMNVTGNSISCQCNHLTNFAAFLEESFVEIVPKRFSSMADVLSRIGKGSLHSMFAVGLAFILYVTGVAWGYRRDRIMALKARRQRARAARAAMREGHMAAFRGGKSKGGGHGDPHTGARAALNSAGSMLSTTGGRAKKGSWGKVMRQRIASRHIWASILSKRLHPTFSRAQQATVLLVVAMAAMMLNAFIIHSSVGKTLSDNHAKLDWDVWVAGVLYGLLTSLLLVPLTNGMAYLFMVCGRLRESMIEQARYAKHLRYRTSTVYVLLWLSTVLYVFCVLMCACAGFLVLLYGTQMDEVQGAAWSIAVASALAFDAFVVRPLVCAFEAAFSMRVPPPPVKGRPGRDGRGRGGGIPASKSARNSEPRRQRR